tara:strand:+ start:630 stop:1796 length:1167 start_codon:yes stop_codon:yes gene_type:complete
MLRTTILRNIWESKETYKQTLQHIDSAFSINPKAYTCPDYYKIEKKKIFKTGWIPIGYTNELNNNNIVSTNIGEIPIIMTRDKNDKISAFHNVCRHRGCKLIEDNKRASMISCPYHKWSYKLDGSLVGTPLFKTSKKHFNKEQFSLFPVNIEVNNNIIFGNLKDDNVPSPKVSMKSAFKLLDNYPLEKCNVVKTKEYRVKANWKLLVDNFIEYYHLPAVHPELVKGSGMDEHVCTQKEGKYISFKTDPLTEAGLPIDVSKKPVFSTLNGYNKNENNNSNAAHFHALFPNMFYFLFPNHIFSIIVSPISPTESLEKAVLMVEDNAQTPIGWVNELFEFYDKVNKEDIEICEMVQKGLKSDMYLGGKLVPKYESTIHRYHKLLIDEMTRS